MSVTIARQKTRPAKKMGAVATGYEPISVTVPSQIVKEARARHGKRDFSAFVARAMVNELVRESQDDYLTVATRENPIDESVYSEFAKILSTATTDAKTR